jgi:hypothetical protein
MTPSEVLQRCEFIDPVNRDSHIRGNSHCVLAVDWQQTLTSAVLFFAQEPVFLANEMRSAIGFTSNPGS